MPRVISIALACLLLGASFTAAGDKVVILQLVDSIQPASLRYLQRGLRAADDADAVVAVIELDTPGGLLPSLRAMTTEITMSRRPVVVYVTPSGGQAASAGFFLLMAADVAVMAPGTNAGAAHPVGGEGAELAKTIGEKVTNDAAALIRSLAAQRGRAGDWAEKAVRESLSYTEREALEKKLIDGVARDRGELLAWLNGREVKRFGGQVETLRMPAPEVVVVAPNAADKLLSVIAHPNIAYLLMLAGLIGLYVELTHPGVLFPGVLGAISLLLSLFALSVLPVSYVGAALIVLSIGFFIAEVKVTSYGLLTVAGVVSFVIGSLMLVDSPIPALRVGLGIVLPSAAAVAAIVIFLLTRVVKSHRMRPVTGIDGLIGEVAEVVDPLEPRGKVFVHGEYYDAVCGEHFPRGARVRVLRMIDIRTLEVGATDAAAGPRQP